MLNLSTDSSQSSSNSGSNGGVDVESETDQSNYPQTTYKLEDFSQQRINRGQQEINYLIVEANKKIVVALSEVKTAIATFGSPGFTWDKLNNAIEDVSKANKEIAGPFPPGCIKPQGEEE